VKSPSGVDLIMSGKSIFGGSNLKDIERMFKRLITSKEGEG
jgi:hypothetical protein